MAYPLPLSTLKDYVMEHVSKSLLFHADDAADRLPFEHVLKCLVDLREWDWVSDEFL